MGVASGCGYQEVGVASGSGWNLWVWLVGGMYGCGYQEVGVVARRRVWLAGGIYGCGYQEVGVVSRRQVWLAGGMYGCGYQEVGVVGTIGVVSGCFPHIIYISLLLFLVSALFCSSIPTFFFHFVKMIFRSCLLFLCNFII